MTKFFFSTITFEPNRIFAPATILLGVVYLFSSCAPTKPSNYFKTLKKDTTLTGLVNKDLESKIGKGDNLRININSLGKEEDLLFNIPPESKGNSIESGFIVDPEGNISVHRLGKIRAIGLTRRELEKELQTRLVPYLRDPIVNVQYLNHKITVMGEVERPTIINMNEEQLSIIDAIVLCGDVKQNARKDHIMVIREEGNEKKVKILNLEDHSIFSSPWYYLQPNDIVYVLPDDEKRQKEERRARFQSNFAIASASISILVILLDRIFR